MKRSGMNALGCSHSRSWRCSSHGAIRMTSFLTTASPPSLSGPAAARAIRKAGGYSRIVSSITARVNFKASNPAPSPAARASAATRSCVSGSSASRYSAQNSAVAVVSWPAKIIVATWSPSCASEKASLVSGSRAATIRSNRSRGGAPSSLPAARRSAISIATKRVQRLRKKCREMSCGVGQPNGSSRSRKCGRAKFMP